MFMFSLGDFIFVHSRDSGLDKSQVGDGLSGWDDKVLTNPQHTAVRTAYLRHFDFGGMDFDHALRVHNTAPRKIHNKMCV